MKKTMIMALAAILMAMPSMAQDRPTQNMFGDGTFEKPENVRAAATPKSVADALRILPAVPTVEQVCSSAAKAKVYAASVQPFKLATEQAAIPALAKDAELQARLDQARLKQSNRGKTATKQYNKNVQAGLMPSQEEMMQMVMSGEINPNWSENKIMDFMAGKIAPKWGVSKDECLKIINMAQKSEKQAEAYLKANHPQLYQRLYDANAEFDSHNEVDNPNSERLAQIMDQITKETENLEAYKGNASALLLMQLEQEWPNSPEAKQIDAIEIALWQRVEQWITGLHTTETVVPYPGWWTDERKKENALIDQWNRKAAQRWIKAVNEDFNKVKPIFERIAALDAENEKLGQSDPDDVIYLTNKLRINHYMGILHLLIQPHEDALRFPCIEHQEETDSAILGKG